MAFHPKTISHAAIKRAIENRLRTHYDTFDPVLIMFSGTEEEFSTFIDSLPKRSNGLTNRIEQDEVEIRGYTTYVILPSNRLPSFCFR